MEDKKIRAYHKIRRSIRGSRNELHLQTCSIMVGIFSVRFNDESIIDILKHEIDSKREELLTRKYNKVLY
jgi:hypothetical protein